jgi:predicted nucleic acid-binding Zn ribbon protein
MRVGSLAEEPRPVGDALARIRRELGTPEPSQLERIRATWPELVGELLAAHSVPLHLRDGILRIGVDDPAWAGQFRYLTDGLVTELAERVPNAAILDISVGASRSRSDAPGDAGGGRGVRPGSSPETGPETGRETPR